MGSQMSSEERSILSIYMKILQKGGIGYDETNLRLLLAWLKSKGVVADLQTAFQLSTWEKAGEVLQEAATGGEPIATKVLTTWRLVKESLQQLKSNRAVSAAAATAPGGTCGESEAELWGGSAGMDTPQSSAPSSGPLLEVPSSTPRLPGFAPPPQEPTNLFEKDLICWEEPARDQAAAAGYDPAAHWRNLRKQALLEGEVEMAAALSCPVITRNQGPNEWQPLPWDLVKELRKTVMQHGLTSPYAQSLLQNVMRGHLLTPFDLRSLADLIFTPTQRVLWESHWRTLCHTAALDNLGRQSGDPLQLAGIPQLMGEAPTATPQLQAQSAPEILRQSAELAYQAMLKVPDTGKAFKSFTSIKQDPSESYTQFIDRLQEAIQKQVENKQDKEALMLKLAVENANADCKKLLQSLRNPTLTDTIETCNRVGSVTYNTEAFAAAFAAAFASAVQVTNKLCFQCGKPGHFKRVCPQRQRGESGNGDPPGICPRCGKGRHFANRCRSKFDKNGQPLSGNGRSSTRQGRARTQIPLDQRPQTQQSSQVWAASEQEQLGVPTRMSPQPPASQQETKLYTQLLSP